MPGKYDHLFVTRMADCSADFRYEGEAAGRERSANIGTSFGLMRAADVDASTVHAGYAWIMETVDSVHWVDEHQHDVDEVLMWTGNDPADPHDLGAELYLDIEGERHTTTTSGAVYIPAGTRHCPLGFSYVRRPFTFVSLLLNGVYASDEDGRSR